MRILALDSSGLVASVAVVEDGAVDDQVIAEYTVNYKKTHSDITSDAGRDREDDRTGSAYRRCDSGSRGAGIIYGTSYRFRNGQGTWTCA